MAVSMQQVKELRDRTQAGLNDCKSALEEAGGDMEQAVEIILKKGLAKSAKRAGAVAAEGMVATQVSDDARTAVIVEVNIQTDFAARNPEFVAFASKVVDVAMASDAGADLAAAPFPGTSGTVEDARQALVGKLGENIQVRRWAKLSVGANGRLASYVHTGGSVGVLVALESSDAAALDKAEVKELMDNVAMQTAAMAPICLRSEDMDAETISKQQEIFDAQLAEEGKPEQVRGKIVEGKIKKWLKEVCLVEQQSVIDSEKTVADMVAATGKLVGATLQLTQFRRFERGEGIVRPTGDDFAAEVAKMAST